MKSRVVQEKSSLFFPGYGVYGLWIYGFPKMTIGSIPLSRLGLEEETMA